MKIRKKSDLREIFLQNFIENLVRSIPVKEQITEKEPGKLEQPKTRQIIPSGYQQSIAQSQALQVLSPISIQQQEKLYGQPILEEQETIVQAVPKPIMQTLGTYRDVDKITPFLRDPTILSIECQGPGKNILINRSGIIQATPIILSKDEIDKLMEDFSEKTRIPLIKGVFKAALSNFIITAVISEFVGTRFYIEKIRAMPFAPVPIRR